MMPENQREKLNMLVNHFMMLGTRYNAIKRDFQKEGDKGIVMFLDNEMEERFQMADKIADFIQDHDGIVTYKEIPAPLHAGPTPIALESLNKLEKQTLDTLKTFYESEENKENSYGKFLKKLIYSEEMEVKEINAIVTKIQTIMESPFEMMLFDEWLIEKYSKHYEMEEDYEG